MCDWKDINFLSDKKDQETFERSNPTIAINPLFLDEKEKRKDLN